MAGAALQHQLRCEIAVVAGAATVASLIESLLGATLEPKGILNNDLLNFVTTWSAGVIAVYVV